MSALLIPVTAPAAALGLVYFLITRRHPTPQLLMIFGAGTLVAAIAAIAVLIIAQ